MSSEIVFIDSYSCPRCRAQLATQYDVWDGWLKCPTCGLASLPPEPQRVRTPRQPSASMRAPGDGPAINESPELFMDPDYVAPGVPIPAHISPARLVFRTGLLVSLGLMLIFFLDQNTTNTAIFGFLAVVFFILLLRLSANRSRPS
jgi:hypothetical protein